jgi:hypothetical protein
MSQTSKIAATDVRIGDRLQARDGSEMTVTRIDSSFALREGMMAFVEDSAEQWMKLPAMADGEVELIARGEA